MGVSKEKGHKEQKPHKSRKKRAGDNRSAALFYKMLFATYMVLLFYLLFFSERMGRLDNVEGYRYNLMLFQEIKRFFIYRDVVGRRAFIINIFGNIAAFMPFGILLPKLSARLKGWFWVMASSLLLSFAVETAQLVFKLGCFDVDDLFLNTLGGLAGYLIYYIGNRSRKRNGSV